MVDEIETEIGGGPGRASTTDRRRRRDHAGNGRVEDAVREILTEIGEDPDRQGLVGTPERVHRMYTELTAGYHVDPDRLINGAIFDVDYSEMVVVQDIPFYSLCEHHLLPFFGTASVAYIPRGRVVGLSKIPRDRRDVLAATAGPGTPDPADRRSSCRTGWPRRASASSWRRPTCARRCAASASPARS